MSISTIRRVSSIAVALTLAIHAVPAIAQDGASLESRLTALQDELEAQRGLIDAQAKRIEAQQEEIDRLRDQVIGTALLDIERGSGLGQVADPYRRFVSPRFDIQSETALAQVQTAGPASLPTGPVGEDPNLPRVESVVAAVPEGLGVLTRPGQLIFDPSLEYSNFSKNRLVFRGIELIPGIQIGVLEADEVDRNAIITTASLRYGLFKNIEVEVRAPYLFRSDHIQFVRQREGSIVRETRLKENALGDVELAVRYQLNRPVGQRPIFVASLRVKSDTGKSPFEIPFDDAGVAAGLATGSGFWSVQPGINFLLPSDPAVIFGAVGYNYHIARSIDAQIGDVRIGRVDPGDNINGNVGFGFALNPRFSFSLGYRHSYIFPTKIELGGTSQRSSGIHVGAFSFGMSYRVTQKRAVNFSVDIGATADAPNVGVSLRAPFELN